MISFSYRYKISVMSANHTSVIAVCSEKPAVSNGDLYHYKYVFKLFE